MTPTATQTPNDCPKADFQLSAGSIAYRHIRSLGADSVANEGGREFSPSRKIPIAITSPPQALFQEMLETGKARRM
jgi:hypothetical protein